MTSLARAPLISSFLEADFPLDAGGNIANIIMHARVPKSWTFKRLKIYQDEVVQEWNRNFEAW